MKYELRTAVVIVLVVSLFFLTSLCKKRSQPVIIPMIIPTILEDEDFEDDVVYESDLEFYCYVPEPELKEEQNESIS